MQVCIWENSLIGVYSDIFSLAGPVGPYDLQYIHNQLNIIT